MPSLSHETSAPSRLRALDDFRGFAILGMVAANFLAGVAAVPAWLKHAPDAGLTFIDLIAPFFIVAIALTYGVSFERRKSRDGALAAYLHFVTRFLAIMALGFIIKLGEIWTGVAVNFINWGVLQAIGMAGLIALVFIRFPWWAQLAIGAAGLAAYQILANVFLGDGILALPHGGAAGAFSWGCMLVLGCGAAKVFHTYQPRLRNLAIMAAAFSAAGLGLAPFVFVSKNRVSASYVLLSVGLSLLFFLGFYLLSEKTKLRLPLLPAWGRNPLLLYCLHLVVLGIWALPGIGWWYAQTPFWSAFLELAVIVSGLSILAVVLARKHIIISL